MTLAHQHGPDASAPGERPGGAVLRATRHPAFGLDGSWTGSRRVGEVPTIGAVIESLGLVHGEGDAVRLEVHATRLAAQDMDPLLLRRCGLVNEATADTPALVPFEGGVLVDGHRQRADAVVTAAGWLLRTDPAPGINVYVHGQGIEPEGFTGAHGLVHLHDLEPYLAGSEVDQRGAT